MKIKIELYADKTEKIVIPDEELEGKTDIEKEKYIWENYIDPCVDNNVQVDYEIIDE